MRWYESKFTSQYSFFFPFFFKKMLAVILIIYKTVFKARGMELFIQDQLDM
jgi:hypothetical protein